jgi:putative ABC transport system substrate-binding protein
MADRLRAFRQGLRDAGFVESENVAIDYRWAYNQLERLPVLVLNDLIQRRVAVIAAPGGPDAALAAKAALQRSPSFFSLAKTRSGLVSLRASAIHAVTRRVST